MKGVATTKSNVSDHHLIFYRPIFDSGILVLSHGEASVALIRQPRILDTVEFWKHLDSPTKEDRRGAFY
jgi:hypothetical protein